MNEQKKERDKEMKREMKRSQEEKNFCIPIRMLFVILFLTFAAKFAENLIFT